MDPAQAAQLGEEVAQKLLQYRQDASGWTICRESNGVSVSWRRSAEFPGSLYRGDGIIHGPPEAVWECLRPAAGGLREKWDDNVTSFEIVQSFTDTLCVSRTATPWAAMRLIAPRDFVDLVLVKTYEDGTITSNGTPARHAWWPSSRRTWAATSRGARWMPSSPAAWPASTPICNGQ
ncbi:stAR-related lipid transfer protein 5 isoform X2 [Talpa occidentalis]|uniref:stAR-related lipid transfer protein 5 isoform X2 n=1 Tax=Talpa occidentalis TaxID=50954 RepID=UPI0018906E79|nr:stAR-related lipid transfer protein 5 isoform X2 [Talpa occidentalis]